MFKSLDFEIKSMKQFQNPFSYSVFDFGLAQPKRPDYFSLFFLFSRSSGPIASGPSTPVGPLPIVFLLNPSHRRHRVHRPSACLPRLPHSSSGCRNTSPPHLFQIRCAPYTPPPEMVGALKRRCRPPRPPLVPHSAL
jgi:hypothetical protein